MRPATRRRQYFLGCFLGIPRLCYDHFLAGFHANLLTLDVEDEVVDPDLRLRSSQALPNPSTCIANTYHHDRTRILPQSIVLCHIRASIACCRHDSWTTLRGDSRVFSGYPEGTRGQIFFAGLRPEPC